MSVSLKNKRILVTGASGFVGRHLVQRLWEDGYQAVSGHHMRYDLSVPCEARCLLEDSSPDIVINLAAVIGGIGANQAKPASFLYGNTMTGLNMMNESAIYGVEKFIQLGSACAYPKDAPLPFKEEDFWNGYPEVTNAPYAIAKRLLLEASHAYRKQYGLNSVYLIPTNLYGPGDNFNLDTSHVIPATIRRVEDAMKTDQPFIRVWGSGAATRDFLYVDDCVEGIIRALENYDGEEPINLGSGHEITIHDMIGLVAEIMSYQGHVVYDSSYPDGQPRRLLDTTRAKNLLGFEAVVSLRKGLEQTIQWWRDQR